MAKKYSIEESTFLEKECKPQVNGTIYCFMSKMYWDNFQPTLSYCSNVYFTL